MVDSEEDLAPWHGEEGPAILANRVEQVFVPRMVKDGISLKPDLVIMASLFWDDQYLDWVSRFHFCLSFVCCD